MNFKSFFLVTRTIFSRGRSEQFYFNCKFYHLRIEVLRNCSAFLYVSFSHEKKLRDLREFQFHKIRTQVMTRMTETEVQKFWSNKQLKKKDWLSLTSYLLSDLFSPEFMIPLQTVDTTFALKVCV